MSTHNIGFYEEISKIITYHQISSNTHLISSAGHMSRIPENLSLEFPTRSYTNWAVLCRSLKFWI